MNSSAFIKKYAVQYLSKYDSTKKNLERVLKNKIRRMNNTNKDRKLILYQSIFKIIEELESKQIINDKRYANTKILFFSSTGKSRYFIKQYLLQKGIEKNLTDEILNKFELENPKWEMESAKIFIRKKRIEIKDSKNIEKNLAKMARAGFNYNLIKDILKIY